MGGRLAFSDSEGGSMNNASGVEAGEFHGLREDEWTAGLLVSRCVGAEPEAYDVNGRQGAVDVVMTYPDGHQAALEITSHAADGARQRDRLLGENGNHWAAPGRYSWLAIVPDPAVIPELRDRYTNIVWRLEELGASNSSVFREQEARELSEELTWLNGSGIGFQLFSKKPKGDPTVYVVPRPVASDVGRGISDLANAVSEILDAGNQRRHIEKLRNSSWAERHLYIALYEGGLPFPLEIRLMDEDVPVPTGKPPRLPKGITHLWLAPRSSPFLIEIHRRRWSFHPLMDLAG